MSLTYEEAKTCYCKHPERKGIHTETKCDWGQMEMGVIEDTDLQELWKQVATLQDNKKQ